MRCYAKRFPIQGMVPGCNCVCMALSGGGSVRGTKTGTSAEAAKPVAVAGLLRHVTLRAGTGRGEGGGSAEVDALAAVHALAADGAVVAPEGPNAGGGSLLVIPSRWPLPTHPGSGVPSPPPPHTLEPSLPEGRGCPTLPRRLGGAQAMATVQQRGVHGVEPTRRPKGPH